jgi:hypothetical protein
LFLRMICLSLHEELNRMLFSIHTQSLEEWQLVIW